MAYQKKVHFNAFPCYLSIFLPVTYHNYLHPFITNFFSGKVKFDVSVSQGNGHFEVCESGALVASGRIYQPDSLDHPVSDDMRNPSTQEESRLTARDVYKELRLRGYDYGPTFQGIISANSEGKNCCGLS